MTSTYVLQSMQENLPSSNVQTEKKKKKKPCTYYPSMFNIINMRFLKRCQTVKNISDTFGVYYIFSSGKIYDFFCKFAHLIQDIDKHAFRNQKKRTYFNVQVHRTVFKTHI